MSELLQVDQLAVRYPVPGRAFGRRQHRYAVQDVSFRIGTGETFGLVGESGSGKTTTGRAILGLVAPTSGRIVFDGTDVASFGRSIPLSYRRAVQVVFQNPTSALNPSRTVEELLAEPLRIHRALRAEAAVTEVDQLLDRVGLAAYQRRRYPWELSGGQRQRVAIARALAVEPRLLVCDEPVSALDVSTQSQVINLLEDLQEELGISYLFVAHDLSVVRHISQQVGVMYGGRLLETGPAERVYTAPSHPYTQTLLAAIPVPDPRRQRENRALRRSLRTASSGGPAAAEVGCPFQHRCPKVMDVCRTEMPAMRPVDGGGAVACHAVASVPDGTETSVELKVAK